MDSDNDLLSLDFQSVRAAYVEGFTPEDIINRIYDRIAARGEDSVWIHQIPRVEALAVAAQMVTRWEAGEDLPLFGIPFAVKDNIDVAGLPTTAACPEFAYTPEKSAFVVQRLIEAGAILIGKTNLDQFATGLVGTRSPYGAPSSVFDPNYISGGSSSGSAVAVAAGLVSFALGTDTAGSGRVPAAFNNIIGWKPTRGRISTQGLVPACQSLDCISVFALTCGDVREVMAITSQYNASDPYSRMMKKSPLRFPEAFRFGVPAEEDWKFFGDREARELYRAAIARLKALGGVQVELDYTPFREAAELLYSGPWVAERLAGITPFIDEHPEALHPITERIIRSGARFSAVETFQAFYRLKALRRQAAEEWARMDVLLLPTTGTIYTHAELEADPIQLNTNLGYYTNFVNLFDLCGVAVPAGFRSNGLPFGVSLLAPAFQDAAILSLAERAHAALGGCLGGTSTALEKDISVPVQLETSPQADVLVAVVGAHLTGQPLNHQLTDRGAVRIAATHTAAEYRLHALAGTSPPKPGLVHAPGFEGPGIKVEVWRLSIHAFGDLVAAIPPPLAMGTIRLADGSSAKGFLCEPSALQSAEEITAWGGWLAWQKVRAADGPDDLTCAAG